MGLADFLKEGGGEGFGSPVSRGVAIRKDTVEEQLKDFDKLVVEGGAKLDVGMANDKKKNEIKDILMRRLKTTNAGLVLSELESSFNFDGPDIVEIKPSDINDIEKRIIFSVADLTQDTREITKVDAGVTPKTITPFPGKLTGAAATQYEIAEEYAKRNGVPIEIALQRANFRGIETGIPISGPQNLQVTGRAGALETDDNFGSSTKFNIERNLNDPAYTYDVFDAQGNVTKKTAYESSGERKYVLTEALGRLDNLSNVNRQIDDNMFSNFGIYNQIDPRTGQITIKSGDPTRETFSFNASQHSQTKAKEHITSIFNRYGEVTAEQISSITNKAYEDFWDTFEGDNYVAPEINNLHLYNNIDKDVIKYAGNKTVENPYKDIKGNSKRKEAFYQDLKKYEGQGVADTFKLFANDINQIPSEDGYVPRNRGSSLAYRKSNDSTTKLVLQAIQLSEETEDKDGNKIPAMFRIYFNDMSTLDGTRQDLARYL
jgi:hypothetical protein